MMPLSFTAKSDELVLLSGDLTFASIDKKTARLIDFKKINCELVIDLTGINNSDSAGLALLIEWLKLSKAANTPCKFSNVPPQLLTLAKLGGFELEAFFVS